MHAIMQVNIMDAMLHGPLGGSSGEVGHDHMCSEMLSQHDCLHCIFNVDLRCLYSWLLKSILQWLGLVSNSIMQSLPEPH